MTTKLTWAEHQRIKDIKMLDLQLCDLCHCLNILNLGWKPFGEFFCLPHNRKHILCWNLCYKASLNIIGCELYKKQEETIRKAIKSNRKYNLTNCYYCQKELKGAGKHGIIKNRNNSTFWGIGEKFISCLRCIGKKYYRVLNKEKRRTFNKYLKRGYE